MRPVLKYPPFFCSSIQHQVYFNILDGRRAKSTAKEKVAFLSCYSNRVLLGAKFSSLGLPRPAKTGIFFCIPTANRQIRRAFLACVVGP
ncbi:hypothetical protein QR685DRAFT_438054 [Neurospora intermedia]|uniref:Uncharacterized protein n=1 Tax=Neurospora intermedia TaxID=5142 RepID=A0ABR3DJ03_NEUIN